MTEFAKHCLENHSSEIIKMFDANTANYWMDENEDTIGRVYNLNSKDACLGTTGQYYCGANIEVCNIDGCCNGSCGPNDGCNCRACMVLDIT